MIIQVEQDGVLEYVTKQQLFDLAKHGRVGPETRLVVNGKDSTVGHVQGIRFGQEEALRPRMSSGILYPTEESGDLMLRCSQCNAPVIEGQIQCLCGRVFNWTSSSKPRQEGDPWYTKPLVLYLAAFVAVIALMGGLLSWSLSSPPPTTPLTAVGSGGPTLRRSQRPKLSDIFRTQLVQYLRDGAKLIQMSEDGVNLDEFSRQLSEVKATFSMIDEIWPLGFAGHRPREEREIEVREMFKEDPDATEETILKMIEIEPQSAKYHFRNSHRQYDNVLRFWKMRNEAIEKDYSPAFLAETEESVRKCMTEANDAFKKGREIVMNELAE